MAYLELLDRSEFLELLFRIDEEQARRMRLGTCPCGGPLHWANFLRKPRGWLASAEVPPGREVRFALCCGWCRRRALPESVRFLGRKVYLGAAVAVAEIVRGEAAAATVRLFRQRLGASWRTFRRWQRWWAELTGSWYWETVRGRLPPGTTDGPLPQAVLAAMVGEASVRLTSLLRLLGPLTSGRCALAEC